MSSGRDFLFGKKQKRLKYKTHLSPLLPRGGLDNGGNNTKNSKCKNQNAK